MRTTIFVIAVLVSMLSASAVYAQRVESALVDGSPVIYCEGMPPAAYTTTTKGSTVTALKTAAANATVYKRFAVHKSDNSTSSNWTNAFGVCSSVGAGWRLPTQRELMLMWVLRSALEKGDFTSFNTYNYWSATEYDRDNSWAVGFSDGNTYDNGSKTNGHMVRCVKELAMP